MAFDPHRRAESLLTEERAGGITAEDSIWLRTHVAECAACAQIEEELNGILLGLKSFAFDMDPASIPRTRFALANHVRKRVPARKWALAAAVLCGLAAAPFYRQARDAQQDRRDAQLMEQVERRVWRAVPQAMEPLVQPQTEDVP